MSADNYMLIRRLEDGRFLVTNEFMSNDQPESVEEVLAIKEVCHDCYGAGVITADQGKVCDACDGSAFMFPGRYMTRLFLAVGDARAYANKQYTEYGVHMDDESFLASLT